MDRSQKYMKRIVDLDRYAKGYEAGLLKAAEVAEEHAACCGGTDQAQYAQGKLYMVSARLRALAEKPE